jgi:hypothetical protein
MQAAIARFRCRVEFYMASPANFPRRVGRVACVFLLVDGPLNVVIFLTLV